MSQSAACEGVPGKEVGMVHRLFKGKALRIIVEVVAFGILLSAGTLALFSQGTAPVGRDPDTFKYLVGADYFPAFHYDPCGFGDTWLPIKLAEPWVAPGEVQPKRPLAYLGYYDDAQPSTWDRQITLANKYGVAFFFVQYGLSKGAPLMEVDRVLDALLASSNLEYIRFALNWMDGDEREFSRRYFTDFLDHVDRYFRSPSYLKIDGKPVIGLLHWHNLLGSLKDRIDDMQAWARGKGYPGLYFVASSVAPAYGEHLGASKAFAAGVSAVTCLAWPLAGTAYADPRPEGKTAPYGTATEALSRSWEDAYVPLGATVFPFPNSGWDDTPWGGKKAFVRTGSSADEFRKQLVAAKEFLDEKKTNPRIVTVVSWNEWGEGHFVEPCETYGYGYLEAIGRTFNGIDEGIVLPLDPLPPDITSVTPSELVFDDFVSDGKSWVGYVGDPKSCIGRGSCQNPSNYGAVANLRIQNLNPDGTLSGGVLSYVTTTKDPMFAKLVLGLNGDVHDTLEMRYRLGAAPDGKRYTDLTVYWTNEEDHPPIYGAFGYFNFGSCLADPFCCSQTYWGALVADGEWHVLQVKLDDPKWRGTIWSVRIELPHGSAPGVPVDVDYVHFQSGSG